ncbi:hypothetical protein [Paenibacillus aceris]|uniref:Uncharacterized protein n=1 Tax=Paenibacillus aceris TaxID=869555 RepID=A0ABS4I464_9BACL|nr:hypothetical protein [Paenibacillus aceris]MBP1965704.1 hypothetical protein [Paenibacillus aceris]NHW36416.1 hypothetical protein [Paenibacillus aceris]
MLQQISDYVFMGSLGLLVVSLMLFSPGSGGRSNYINTWNTTGALTDLQRNHDHTKMAVSQHNWLVGLLKSYLFWIPISGMILSVILSKI